MLRRVAPTLAALALAAGPAAADYQVRGTFQYTDRVIALGGFTGAEPNLPIRLADVQVVDANTQQVLGSGATDASGQFTINVVDSQTRDITVRALTSSNQTADLFLTVRNTTNAAVYAIALATVTNHPSNADIDFTASPVVAPPGGGGDAFNIYDQLLDGLDFLATLRGSRPGASFSLTAMWATGSSNGTFYDHSTRTIFLLGLSSDSDGYDDPVLLHELGHYVEFNFADSDNPGGPHFLNACHDPRLTWSEGWGTFFQNMVRQWKGLSRPDIYVDTNGQPGPGGAFISYDVETAAVGIPGFGNEVSVNAVLWDVVDVAGDADATPGVDDDPLQLADGPARFWDVHANYMPTASNLTAEDFWDGWFARGNGMQAFMETTFGAFGLDFFADPFEPDDSVAQARDGSIASGTTSHTIYDAGDADWTRFDGVAGGTYVFETLNLPCASDTKLDLFAADGVTLLASNDDRSPGDPASRIQYTPAQNGSLYLRVTRTGDVFTYATYDLRVDITVPVLVTDVSLRATATGIEIAWTARADGGFSHFDVQRGTTREGPFVTLNAAPIVAQPGDAGRFAYVDTGVPAGETRFYRLIGVEEDGSQQAFGPWEATAAAPPRPALLAPVPNPFNPATSVRFDLPRAAAVRLVILDVAGRRVRTLLDGARQPAGRRVLLWDGRDDAGREVASGVYLVRLQALGEDHVQRAVLVR